MKSIFTLLSLLITTMLFSQTVLFQEDFEGTVNMTSSSTGSGTWVVNTRLQSQGLKSDSATVTQGDTTYLTMTSSISAVGKPSLYLQFSHIAKVEFFDSCFVEASGDGGTTWTRLTSNEYLGSGYFANGYFSAATYSADWQASAPAAQPQNSWWKTELFNISAIAGDSANVKVRFVLVDGNNSGSGGNAGWFLDSISLTGAVGELTPPTISLVAPVLGGLNNVDTVYGSGPFDITAHITDDTGIDSAVVIYQTSTGVFDTIGMSTIATDTFQASIPFYGFGRSISYYVKAVDASASHNTDSTATRSFFCKYSSSQDVVIGTDNDVNIHLPMEMYYGYSYTQSIFKASYFNGTFGNITKVAYYYDGTGAYTDDIKIYMGTTSLNAFASNTAWIPLSNLTLVYDGTITTTTTAGWIELTLQTPFNYNGGGNLVIAFDENTPGYHQSSNDFYCTQLDNDASSIYFYEDLTNPDPASPPTSGFNLQTSLYNPNVKLTVIPPSTITNDIGVNQITNPTGGVTAGAPMPVNVTIKNYGEDTITYAKVLWKYDGVLQTPVYTFTDSLKSDSVSSVLTLATINPTYGPHNITAWTEDPDSVADINFANDSSSINFYACSALLNGTYTIDPSGSGTNNFTSFSAAVTELSQCGISGPVTFNVANGIYNEQIIIPPVNGSSATNTITFQGASGDSSLVTMKYNASAAADNFVVKLDGGSYITFKDMSIVAEDSLFARVFVLDNNVHNLTIANSVVKSELLFGNSSDNKALVFGIDSVGDNINIQNSLLVNGYYAVYLEGGAIPSNGWSFTNNIIDGYYYSGVYLKKANSAVVSNNYMQADTSSTASGHKGIFLSENSGSTVVSNNKIYTKQTAKSFGIKIMNCIFDLNTPASIYNNMMQVHSTDNGGSGMLIHNTENCNLNYNTVNVIGSANDNGALRLLKNNSGTFNNVNIVNNIFTNADAGGYLIKTSGVDTSEFSNNYNDLYNFSGTKFISYNGNDVDNLAAWQAESGEAANSVVYNPNYIAVGDLHVSNNQLNNIGTPIAGITTDIDGDVRNTTTPDMGADEFDASPNDIYAIDFLSPMSDCGLSNAETVIVRYKNVGSASITSFDAEYQVMGSSTVVTEAVSSTILPGDTLTYTFNTTVDMDINATGADSTFELTAWGTLTGDSDHTNDTTYTEVLSGFIPDTIHVDNDTILYQTSDTLYASGLNPYWWASDTASTELVSDTMFVTGPLYDTTTYWVSDRASSGLSDAQIGNGTTQNSTFSYPTPYGQYFTGSKEQYLIKASELVAMGVSAGPIVSLGFDVTAINGPTSNGDNHDNFTIKMKNTSSSALTTNFETGLTQTFTTSTYQTVLGWNIHQFDTPFIWDGTSNLLVEVCFDNYTTSYSYSNNAVVNSTNTSFVSTINYHSDGGGVCTNATGTTYSKRPNMKLTVNGQGCFSDRTPVTVVVTNIPLHDVGIVSLLSPNSGIELSSTEAVSVVVKNLAAVSKDTIPMAYQLDSNAIVYDTLFYHLNQSDTVTFTFAQTLNLDTFGTYNLVVFTDLAIDVDHSNDTIISQITNSPLTYCSSGATSAFDDDIGNVTFAGINNTSPTPYNGTYTDYTNLAPAQIQSGMTYPISVDIVFSGASGYSGYCEVYIDFNHDGVFDEPSEVAFGAPYPNMPTTLSGFITVPYNAVPGVVKMRVVAKEAAGAATVHPCGTYSWGETEDYFVNIISPLAFDAGVIDIANIPDTTYEGTIYTPHIIIRNYGYDTLTNVDIKYSVNGGAAVSYNYTDTLVPQAVDTVAVNAFASPAGISNIVAYTEVVGDSSNLNDTSYYTFFSIPTKDAYLTMIEDFDETCGMTTDTVVVWIKNTGIDTINAPGQLGQSTVSYIADLGTSATVVTENFNALVAPGDSVSYTFNALIDFTNTSQYDSVYNVAAWIAYPGDNVSYNDTAYTEVNSLHIPADPIVVSPVNVPYGTSVVLTATSVDTILWYHSDTASIEFHQGGSYTTPTMYNDDTLYLAAVSGGGVFKLTETVQFKTGTGSSTYPAYLPGSDWDGVEISNISNGYGNLSGYEINVSFNSTTYTYVFPAGTQVSGGEVVLAIYGSGLTVGPAGNNVFYINSSSSISISSNTLVAYWLKDPAGNIVDAFASNGAQFPANSGVTAADFSGSLLGGANHVGAIRTIADNNLATDWIVGGNGVPASFGYANPQIPLEASQGCSSNRVQMIIDVGSQPANDVAANLLISPVSDVYLTSNEMVTVRVKNFGTNDQDTIPVAYVIDNNAPVIDTIFTNVPSNDSIDFTFSVPADLSISDSTYAFTVYTYLASDVNHLNDTIHNNVSNLLPTYCTSGATSTDDDDIGNVTFAGINNTSPAPYNGTYTDYTNLAPAQIQAGMTYPISLDIVFSSPNSTYNGYCEVYIDYNQNGVFDEPSEVAFGAAYPGATTLTGDIRIPYNALPGTVRMRVVAREFGDANSVQPCGTYGYGETEDYMVVITPPIPHDAGIESILNPQTVSTSNSSSIDVRVRNFGTDTINSVDVSYILNGGTPVTITYNATAIAPMDSMDISLGNITIQEGANTICAYTTLVGDSNSFNDTLCMTTFLQATVNLSYDDDFEGQDLWMPDTLVNQWERGIPAMTNINTAHSPVNVWGIDLNGQYANNSAEFLYTPRIVTTGLDSAILKFWNYYDTQSNDGGAIQVSVDNGPWITLGLQTDPLGTNWYNSSFGGNPWWSGNSNGWVESTYKLMLNNTTFNNPDTVQFRFYFISNGSGNNSDGWAIDDFSVDLIKIPLDAGVVSINSPAASVPVGSNVTVAIDVKNFGSDTLTSIPVSYTIGTTTETATFTIPAPGLLPDSVKTYTFATGFTAPNADFNICAKTDMNDLYPQNDETCKQVQVTMAPIDVKTIGLSVDPSWNDTTKITFDNTVKVQVVNNGTTTLTSINLEYSVGSSVKGTGTWTGSLASLDTLVYTFADTYKSPIGYYQVCAKATVTGDADNTNDEFCKNYLGLNNVGIAGNGADVFSVEQNQPNPAHGKVTVNFTIPQSGKVHFELRNALGQVIITEELDRQVGKNQIEIDATDLASGVYYYTVEFDKKRITKKMLVNN